jgi:hypothetical protein
MDIIKLNLIVLRWSGIDWIDMVLDREQLLALVYMVMSLLFL